MGPGAGRDISRCWVSSGCCSSESWTGHPPCCCLFTTWCERSSAPGLKTVSMGKEQGPYWYQPFFPLSFLPGSCSLRLQGCTPLLGGQGGPSKRRGLTASSNKVLVKALPPTTQVAGCRLSLRKLQAYMPAKEEAGESKEISPPALLLSPA